MLEVCLSLQAIYFLFRSTSEFFHVCVSFSLPLLVTGKRILESYRWTLFFLYSCKARGTKKLSLHTGEYSLQRKSSTLETGNWVVKKRMRIMKFTKGLFWLSLKINQLLHLYFCRKKHFIITTPYHIRTVSFLNGIYKWGRNSP